jgi:hypothetical protein
MKRAVVVLLMSTIGVSSAPAQQVLPLPPVPDVTIVVPPGIVPPDVIPLDAIVADVIVPDVFVPDGVLPDVIIPDVIALPGFAVAQAPPAPPAAPAPVPAPAPPAAPRPVQAPAPGARPAPAPAPPAPAAPPAPPLPAVAVDLTPAQLVNIQLDIVIVEEVGGAAPVRKNVTLTVADRETGSSRAMDRSVNSVATLNVDVWPVIQKNGRVLTRVGLEYQNSRETPMVQVRAQPLLESGRLLRVSRSASPNGDRTVTVDVTATILK